MKDRWFWLVGGGPMQVEACKILRRLDLKIFVTDADREFACKPLVDDFDVVDTYDIEGHLKIARTGKVSKLHFVGVACIATDCHETVATLSQEMALPGITPRLSREIGNKIALRKRLTKIGVAQPEFYTKSQIEADGALLNMMLAKYGKIIIKPVGLSASKGMKVVSKSEKVNFSEAFERAVGLSRQAEYIVEELLESDGKFASEASIETVVINGEVQFLNMVDRIFNSDLDKLPKEIGLGSLKSGVEFGHINPTSRHDLEVEEIVKQLQCLVTDLEKDGIYSGESFILKADIFFSKSGPIILECTPRSSGGWDSSFSSILRGKPIQEIAIGISLGMEVQDKLAELPRQKEGFVAVISDVNEASLDCLGRTFTGSSLKPTAHLAILDAIKKQHEGVTLS